MDFSLAVLSIAGAIALLLWGTHMVQTGVQRAFGPRLRVVLGGALDNRLKAFGAGAAITVLLQSSTATCLMATNLAAGAVDLVPAMAVMLGANVGTALIVQVLSFNVAALAPVAILGGYLMFRRSGNPVVHDLGRALIGLGLMLLALHQMLGSMEEFAGSAQLKTMLGVMASVPILALVLAAIAAWIVHSSVAVVVLVISLAANGVLPLDAAFVLVLGANLGTAVNPLLEAGDAADPASRRVPLSNLINRIAGIAVAFPLVGWFATLLQGANGGAAVAIFHLGFNLAVAAVFLALLKPMAMLVRKLLPDRVAPDDPSRPIYLDPTARETPIIALGAAAREALRLSDSLKDMLESARDALKSGNRRLISETRDHDDVLDSLNRAIKEYLSAFDPDALSDDDRRRLSQILTFSMNMEQAGDVIDRNLLPHASKRMKRGLALTSEEEAKLATQMDRLISNLATASSLLMTEDVRAARLLAEEKLAFRRAEHEATQQHFEQLRGAGQAQSSAIKLDLLRDMKLINSLIVAAAAYPVLDKTGELLPTRLAAPPG